METRRKNGEGRCKSLSSFAVIAAVSLFSLDVQAAFTRLGGRNVIDRDWDGDETLGPIGEQADAVVLQTNHNVVISGGHHALGKYGHIAAYLLEGGTLRIDGANQWRPLGVYSTFRMSGGEFSMGNTFWRSGDETDFSADMLPVDLVFGGNAAAKVFLSSNASDVRDYNFAVMKDAEVSTDESSGVGKAGGTPGSRRTIAANGGTMYRTMLPGMETNTVYSFNGGHMRTMNLVNNNYNGLFGNSPATARDVHVRIYEKGGGAAHRYPEYDGKIHSANYAYMPDLLEPVGNVVKSVVLTSAARNNGGAGWDYPPAVVITDDPGCGSNAVAIADYDYFRREVTNITILCRGENYSANAKAELRYRATGDALATLDCEVGECHGGDFTLGGCWSYTMVFDGCTNTYHGATIVDMDPDGLADSADMADNRWRGGSVVLSSAKGGVFLNSTNLVIRSGLFDVYWANKTVADAFPACRRLELYGGYLSANGSSSGYSDFETVVVGGVAWLNLRKGSNTSLGARVAVTDTFCVDVACMANGTVPAIKSTYTSETASTRCGRIKFNTGCRATVENWDGIPAKGGWQTILDLSEVWVNRDTSGNAPSVVSGTCTPEIVAPEGSEELLRLKWELDGDGQPARLMAKRLFDGCFLIFR